MSRTSPVNTAQGEPGAIESIALIADKWSLMVIFHLNEQTLRYSELQARLGKISSKVLTLTLRRLERDGLLQRKLYPVIPPRVDYSLTPLGQTLVEPIKAFCRWSVAHFAEVKQAREYFDQRKPQF
jgi:DNA-binding HxlR family transcriptional regulator